MSDRSPVAPSQTTRQRGALLRFLVALRRLPPAKLLLLGYVSYILIGWIVLALPLSQSAPVAALDTLFIATSAVSTTGLVSVDPGTSFTFAGELTILLLIQIGGLGYMTIGSYALLIISNRMGRLREETVREAFHLPKTIRPAMFLRSVVIYTLLIEALGALALYLFFRAEGVENPIWSAIFHAISAFCTAGFSLNPNSFEDFTGHTGIVLTLSILSILGAVGFLVVVDFLRAVRGRDRRLGVTSRVILRVTFAFLVVGTLLLMVAEPSLQALPAEDRLKAAFFQVMTASTTVGFNTVPVGALAIPALMLTMFLMIIGASPAGTGGGLRTTAFAALSGLVRSTTHGRDTIRFMGHVVPGPQLQAATAALAFYLGILTIAMFLLGLTDATLGFEQLMFEAISALGTVGLSMGITGDLSPLGKVIVIVLMTAGRVGILTFGIALATREDEETPEVRDDEGELVI